MLSRGDILFVGHGYHRKTRSSVFFLRLLSELGSVEEIYDDSYLPGGQRRNFRAHATRQAYALIVVWQIEYAALQLAGMPNVLFVPMFDSCRELPADFWRRLKGMKILAFSLEVYHRAQKGNCRARYVQYWPETAQPDRPIPRRRELAYYWYRRNDIGLSRLEWICHSLGIEELVIHYHPDPVVTEAIPRQSFLDRLSPRLRFADWEDDRTILTEELAGATCYIASRPFEGIGMAFPEAMAAGCCVVAPRNPTYTDYVVSGENGLLYSQALPGTLPADGVLKLGAAAAAAARAGRERWLATTPELLDWIVSGNGDGILLPGHNTKLAETQPLTTPPLISIITVVRNAPQDLAETIASVTAQRGVSYQYVVVDGASQDDTAEVARAHLAQIDVFVSRPDAGIYDAMNKSLELANCEFVLFMNAGDTFVSPDSLAELMQARRQDSDVIVGHHIYCRGDGTEALHRVNHFQETADALRQGMLSNNWEHGMPCHQATATRRTLLQRLGYDTRLRVAADRDFLFRASTAGARFAVSDRYIARYKAGGFSQRNAIDCVMEWQDIAERHTSFARNVRQFYAMRLLEAFERDVSSRRSAVNALRASWRYRAVLLQALALSDGKVVARHLLKSGTRLISRQNGEGVPRSFHATSKRPPRDISLYGFSYSENAGTWTESAEVEIAFPAMSALCRKIDLHLAAITRQLDHVPLAIRANGVDLGWFVPRRGRNTIVLPQPMQVGTLQISMRPTLSPRDLGTGDDDRSLGIMISRIVVR